MRSPDRPRPWWEILAPAALVVFALVLTAAGTFVVTLYVVTVLNR